MWAIVMAHADYNLQPYRPQFEFTIALLIAKHKRS